MEKRTTIRLNDETIGILNEAGGIWPEHAESMSALIRAVISDWWRNRQENGGKSDIMFAVLYLSLLESGASIQQAKMGAAEVKKSWKEAGNVSA